MLLRTHSHRHLNNFHNNLLYKFLYILKKNTRNRKTRSIQTHNFENSLKYTHYYTLLNIHCHKNWYIQKSIHYRRRLSIPTNIHCHKNWYIQKNTHFHMMMNIPKNIRFRTRMNTHFRMRMYKYCYTMSNHYLKMSLYKMCCMLMNRYMSNPNILHR